MAASTGLMIKGASVVPALEIVNLSHSYGRTRHALRDIQLSLMPGAWLGLIGPNGAGKTTLIRCICGLIQPVRGTIKFGGTVLDRDQRHDQLGIIPQEIALYETLTLTANLTAFGRLHGLRGSQLRRRVRWALRWIGLENRADERIATFSGGMKRRVNIACGVLHQPQTVILDEPTVGVDPQSRNRIYEMLSDLRKRGSAILMTTHHLDEVEQRCDSIAILDHGKILAQGKLSDLIRETVGDRKLVSVACPTPPPVAANRWKWNADTRRLTTAVDDVAGALPELLTELRDCKIEGSDLHINSPSLHQVFVHLTGRQLRE